MPKLAVMCEECEGEGKANLRYPERSESEPCADCRGRGFVFREVTLSSEYTPRNLQNGLHSHEVQ